MSEKSSPKRTSKPIEVEVPGTPEQVWQAIATGPGISAWLFPTDVEERPGGAVTFHMAPGMESSGTITTWDPPRCIAYEEPNWSEGAPPLGTEFVIEARAGGTCVVRLVHSLFTDSDQWDKEFDGFEKGWRGFFQVLRLYLARFPGRRALPLRVMQSAAGSEADVWNQLARALEFSDLKRGDRWTTSGLTPPTLTGTVEYAGEGSEREMLVALSEPGPGIALVGVGSWNDQVFASMSIYLYSEDAALAREVESAWQAWMAGLFGERGAA
ncbi:MAG TPA: SRPBCC domain-containing protein [Polyangiaceae bacterium]